MIRNVVFDMGGVLIAWDPARIVARLGLSGEDAQLLLREVFQSVEWVSLDRGSLSEQAALERFYSRLPRRLHEAAVRCVFWWKDELWPVPGMAELIQELDGLGYGIYLLSNASCRQHDYWPRIPASKFFDGKLISCDVKVVKPCHKIYRLFTEKFSLNPEECVFIDDSAANAAGAVACGWKGIVFHGSSEELERKLRNLGVEF